MLSKIIGLINLKYTY